LKKGLKLVGDLSWTRLTGLREMISNVLQDHQMLDHLKDAQSIEVEYTDRPITAQYLAGWLQSAAPTAAIRVKPSGGPKAAIHVSGPGLDINIDLCSPLVFRINGMEHRAMLPFRTEANLMREELSILQPDAVFTAAFQAAASIAIG